MIKNKLIKVCDIAAFIFALSFVIRLVHDLIAYRTMLTSFPFWAFLLVNGVQYLLPAAFLFLIGRVLRHLRKKEQETDTDPVR